MLGFAFERSVGGDRSASSRSARRAAIAVFAPAAARTAAVASPMPEEAPVTSATRPCSGLAA